MEYIEDYIYNKGTTTNALRAIYTANKMMAGLSIHLSLSSGSKPFKDGVPTDFTYQSSNVLWWLDNLMGYQFSIPTNVLSSL